MEFSRPEYCRGWPFPPSWALLSPGIKPRSPELQADSSPAEPQRKPKNTGVDILSFLQGIFLTQESNLGLLHCRQILYQLSYQGSPRWRSGNNSTCQCRRHKRFNPWVGKIPWNRKWQPTLVFLPGECHGQGSLEGYSPWHHKKIGHDLVTKQQQLEVGPRQGHFIKPDLYLQFAGNPKNLWFSPWM